MKRRRRVDAKSVIDLLEEAAHLLRRAPPGLLGAYYAGTVPFVLGLLYFWADMSRGAVAYQHCGEAALSVALLFLWMKCWQTIFALQLRVHLTGISSGRWTVRRFLRIVVTQTAIQPTALFVLPVAVLLTLPAAWVWAFYHSVTALDDGSAVDVGATLKRAARHASLWPMQNHLLISALVAFAFFVFANVVVAMIAGPYLLKMLAGVETTFTRGGYSAFFNTTFLATACAVTYLCVNPLSNAAYALRCFYGESLRTGSDLKAELRSLQPALRRIAAALLISFCALASLNAADALAKPLTEELDRSISEVIDKPQYTWRFPRERIPPDPAKPRGWLARFFDSIKKVVDGWWRGFKRWMKKLSDSLDGWLRRLFRTNPTSAPADADWITWLYTLVYLLTALVVATFAIYFWRVWRRRQVRPILTAEPLHPVRDLADENVLASQLPTDEWLTLARELMTQGDLRLALRALYLACLAHLGARQFIAIAIFKSNDEYEHELRRHSPRPELLAAFKENVASFERVWYGMHEVTRELVDSVDRNFETIRDATEN